jgi:hypothetical protein
MIKQSTPQEDEKEAWKILEDEQEAQDIKKKTSDKRA